MQTNLLRWLLMAAMAFPIGGCLTGCGAIKPHTKFGMGMFGWNLSDTKDNDIEVKNARYDPKTHEFSVESIVIRNNSSDVMTANVAQMQQITEQMKEINIGTALWMDMIKSVVPGVAGGMASGGGVSAIPPPTETSVVVP